MLSGIDLKNFKAFQELHIKAKPITILCGTNSCGKSSIIQSILLAKQTFENSTFNKTVSLNGKYARLDTIRNVTFKKQPENPIALAYRFIVSMGQMKKLAGSSDIFWEAIFQTQYLKSIGVDVTLAKFIIDVGWGLVEGEEPGTVAKVGHCGIQAEPAILNRNPGDAPKDLIDVTRFMFKISIETADGRIIDGFQLRVAQSADCDYGKYRLEWESLRLSSLKHNGRKKNTWSLPEDCSVECYPVFENLIPFIPTELIEWDDSSSEKIELAQRLLNLLKLRQLLQALFKMCSYIGPLREQPLRRYIYEAGDEINDIGSRGENAVYIYVDQDERYIDYYTYGSRRGGVNHELPNSVKNENNKEGFFLQEHKLFVNAVRTWLRRFGIEGLQLDSNNGVYQLTVGDDEFKVNIADAGFGISQIFPIIVEGLRMPQGGTLILEQPEIHLHPKIQAQLADFFISIALSGKSTIIETHSEHLINRLVRRVIEDPSDKIKDLIGIYFISPTEDGSQVEEILIDDVRGIIHWPKDFFDQAADDIREKLRASVEKRKVIFLRKDDNRE